MSIKTKPRQTREYVVRAGASDRSPVVYRGNNPTEAHNVARANPDATVTFRSELGAAQYLTGGRS